MKKIGFVDYYISEWHANNYPGWIREVSNEFDVAYAWAELNTSLGDGVTTEEWCANMNVAKCDTLEELCEKSDMIVILAPSDPQKHIEYARKVLPYGKPTYIDKPFADTTENALEIFSIAKEFGTPFFSTSALRYATELDLTDVCNSVSTMGGGSNLPEYIIHQAEMIVHKMGVGATALKGQKIADNQYSFVIRYGDDRAAAMHFAKGANFAVILSPNSDADVIVSNIESDFFKLLIQDILSFFESKKPSFDTVETMEVNRIMVAAIQAMGQPDQWISL